MLRMSKGRSSGLVAVCLAGIAAMLAVLSAGSAAAAPARAGASPKVITIGQLISITGPVATICYDQVRGASVAITQAGRMKEKVGGKTVPYLGGIGVVVETQDDKSVASAGATAFRAIVDSNAVAFIGPCSSTVGLAFSQLLDAAKIPQVISNAGSSALPTPEFAFRAGIPEPFYDGRVVHVLKGRGVKTVYLLEGIDNPASVEIEKAVRATMKVLGITVVGSYSSTSTAVNFTPALQQIAELKPDAIGLYASGGAGQTLTEATAIRNAGFKQLLFGPRTLHTTSFLKGGDITKGAIFATSFAPEFPFPVSQRFSKLFTAKFPDIALSPFNAIGYDAMWRVLRAIHDAGPAKIASLSVADARILIQQTLAKQTSTQSAQGPVTYLPNGDVKGAAAVAETDGNGGLKILKVPSVKDLLKK
jgi:ABC-type branched-subunit amino acid transport system substrate-binding protein